MIKLSWISGAALAACLLLAGCFTSEQPLFDAHHGAPIMGTGAITVIDHGVDEKPDGGVLHWQAGAYVDTADKEKTAISFHALPNTWPWDGWYVGQSQEDDASHTGYIYQLYRKQGDKILVYDISCSDLTDLEVQQTHLARDESKQECKATRQEDLAQALRLLSKRKNSNGYWTWKPAPPNSP